MRHEHEQASDTNLPTKNPFIRFRTQHRKFGSLVLIASVITLTKLGWAQTDAASVDQAWSLLHDGAIDKSSDQRTKAIRALGLVEKNTKAARIAEKGLADQSTEVRVASATALGQIELQSSRPKLREALKDKEIKVVLAAANSLYALRDPAAYQVYYAILTGERKGTEGLIQSQLDMLRNRKAIEKLAIETGIGFVPYGGMGYEAWKRLMNNDGTSVVADSAEKLARDPDPKSGKALAHACLDDKWQVRVAVVEAIAKRGDPGLLYAVVPLMQDNSDNVRYEAAAAVLRLTFDPNPRYSVRKQSSRSEEARP